MNLVVHDDVKDVASFCHWSDQWYFKAVNRVFRCMSLRELADSNNNDGGPLSGSGPFDSKSWFADMIFGCKADTYGYYHDTVNARLGHIPTASGYNLNSFACPKTYNPRTLQTDIHSASDAKYVYNVQHLTCTARSGSFRLSFRGQTTSLIHHNSSVSHVTESLQELTTIGIIKIRLQFGGSEDSRICDSSGDTTLVVTFLTEIGNIPELVINDLSLSPSDSISIANNELENSYLYECGGHGECQRDSGSCLCWDGWGSSDGFGGDGIFGDCGASLIK